MVIQCLMVVMQSGWHTARMTSPMLTAELTSSLFSSTFFMNSWAERHKERHHPWCPQTAALCHNPTTPLMFQRATHLVRINERLQCFCVVGQSSPETEGLLGLGEPLQQQVDGRPELFRLGRRNSSK